MSMDEQFDRIIKILGSIGGIIAAIIAVLGGLLALFGKLGEVWERILRPTWNKLQKPILIFLIVLATVGIPDGFMVWLVMYVVAQNADRIRDPTVFLSLTFQLTVILSLYTVFWGLWLYPRLKPWLTSHTRNVREVSRDKQAHGQEKNVQPPTQG